MLPLPASYMKTSRTPLEGLSHQAAFFFPANYEIIRPGAMKGPQTERERDHKAASHAPPLGTWPATQACALTGNQTSNPSVHRLVLNPLSHTSQGKTKLYIKFNVNIPRYSLFTHSKMLLSVFKYWDDISAIESAILTFPISWNVGITENLQQKFVVTLSSQGFKQILKLGVVYTHVHSSIVYNNQDVEATQGSINAYS